MIRTMPLRPPSPMWVVPLVLSPLVACSSSRTLGADAGDVLHFGDPCSSDDDCAPGRCIDLGGRRGCSERCGSDRDCPGGWECRADLGVCACFASPETCNSLDDDCDGAIDEGTGAAVGCPPGATCTAGTCSCPEEHLCGGACVDTDMDPDHCGGCGFFCSPGAVCRSGACCTPYNDNVDLLLMVDNSGTMAEQQASLVEQLPRLVDALASGDLDADGTRDFPPVRSLHVGVISSDMGAGGFMVPTCLEPNFGDDGVLRTQGNTAIPGCMATYPRFLEFTPGDDVAAFAAQVTCVARMGIRGCGFEQPLEAVLKALTPSTSPIAFHMGTSGHADGSNVGFVRPDSLLAIVLLTDEEDCSAADPEIFNPDTSVYRGDLNLRCFQYPEAVHPIWHYVDGLLALRPDPDRLIFAAITGVPTDLVDDPSRIDFAAILGDDRMLEMVDPTMPTRLSPSCNVPGRGLAFPPRRIVQVAQGLEARRSNGLVQSICQADFTPAIQAILERLSNELGTRCR